MSKSVLFIVRSVTLLILMQVNISYALSAGEQLTAILTPIKNFSAHFEQTIKGEKGQNVASCSGLVKIERPGQFYWEILKPNAVKIISDGRFIWTYDTELEQIIKQSAKTTLMNSPAAILAGEPGRLEKDFSVRPAKGPGQNYLLESREADSPFSEMKLHFQDNKLSLMTMKDKMGNTITIQFKQVKVNSKLDANIFKFHPPKGVDVIVSD